jgi:hypothetical protein
MNRTRSQLTLEMPDWVPIEVAQDIVSALDLLRSEAGDREIENRFSVLRRLATDPRMSRVWHEFTRRKRSKYRSTSLFLNSVLTIPPEAARRLEIDAADPGNCQAVAMRVIFWLTYCLATFPLKIVVRNKLRPRALLACRPEAYFKDIVVDWLDLPEIVKTAAAALRDDIRRSGMGLWHVVLCSGEVALMVNRRTAIRDARMRCVGIGIAGVCEDQFGNRLYGTAATMASVALDRNVGLGQIRQWCSEIKAQSPDAQSSGQRLVLERSQA